MSHRPWYSIGLHDVLGFASPSLEDERHELPRKLPYHETFVKLTADFLAFNLRQTLTAFAAEMNLVPQRDADYYLPRLIVGLASVVRLRFLLSFRDFNEPFQRWDFMNLETAVLNVAFCYSID